MLPTSSSSYLMHGRIGKPQLLGNGVNGHGLIKFSDLPDIGLGDSRRATVFAAVMVAAVLVAVHILKIADAIVKSVFVLVMDLAILGAWSDKRKGNQFVNIELAPLVVLEKPKVVIAVLQAKSLVFGVVRLSVAALSSDKLTDALNLPVVADLIQAFVSRYVAPFFKYKLELGIAWGMIVHSKFSLLELAHAQGRRKRRLGNSIGFFCHSILAHLVEYRNTGKVASQ